LLAFEVFLFVTSVATLVTPTFEHGRQRGRAAQPSSAAAADPGQRQALPVLAAGAGVMVRPGGVHVCSQTRDWTV
ncbi:MAG: hypothetical protein ACK56I_03245, partial [bacterium]